MCVLEQMEPGGTLLVGVVANTPSGATAPPGPLAATADEHFAPDRNPWSLPLRCQAAARVSQELSASRRDVGVVSTILPRPSTSWALICAWFPGHRTWAVPERGEEHDAAKAAFFAKSGDSLLRIPGERSVSGREIRDLYARQDPRASTLVPPCVVNLYFPEHASG
jgi:hypothetical protein